MCFTRFRSTILVAADEDTRDTLRAVLRLVLLLWNSFPVGACVLGGQLLAAMQLVCRRAVRRCETVMHARALTV